MFQQAIINTKLFNQTQPNQLLFTQLLELQEQGVLQSVDVHFAEFILSELPQDLDEQSCNLLIVLAAKLSNQILKQNTCIDLNDFHPEVAFGSVLSVEFPRANAWLSCLQQSGLIEQENSPFTLYGSLLYLTRYFNYESSIAHFIQSPRDPELWFNRLSQNEIEPVIDALFESKAGEIDKQKLAVKNALTRRFSVISGGPGTGKTTTVVKLLIALITLHQQINKGQSRLQIQLVAPTGKAAQRLTSSISGSVNRFGLSDDIVSIIPQQASTIHRLLKPRGRSSFYHNAENPIGLDVLVLDEASMVDISLMSKLLSALPKHAQVILLGDKQQLASVEAGNVLAEISQAKNNDFLSELTKSYRFNDASDIGQLASCIKQGDSRGALNKLKQNSNELAWFTSDQNNYARLVEQATEHYLHIRQASADLSFTQRVRATFERLSEFQLLACVRQGQFGVEGLNQQIEKRLSQRLRQNLSSLHYDYRPIMITENAYHLELYNGDIGIELIEPISQQLYAYFLTADDEVKQVHCQRLPQHQTVYAMTVHKSQGSEFNHAALVLPDKGSSLLNREIVYTGLTRAKDKFTLLGSESALVTSIGQKTNRHSGLALMLS